MNVNLLAGGIKVLLVVEEEEEEDELQEDSLIILHTVASSSRKCQNVSLLKAKPAKTMWTYR